MTISSVTRKAGPFTGNDTTDTFPFAFKVFTSADLLVVRLDTDTDIETELVLDTDYTVSLNSNQNASPGGDVVLSANLATGYTLVITSAVQNLQPVDLTNQGGFYPKTQSEALDRSIILIQQLQEQLDRCPKVAITSSTSTETFEESFAHVAVVAQRYIGPAASAPSERANGDALEAGDMYFDTTLDAMRVYTGSGWVATGSSVNGTSNRFRYVATAGQTTFTGADANAATLAYDVGFIDVYLNGLRLDSSEYTASNGTSIVLGTGASLNDELNIVAFGTFEIANVDGQYIQDGTIPPAALDRSYLPTAGGTMTGAVNEAQGADIASAATVNLTSATGNYVNVTGTTTITAITLAQGAERVVRFAGVLTLTHGASLILPTSANVDTTAGDIAVFRGEAAGVVRCVGYMRAGGAPLTGVTTSTAQAATSGTAIDFTGVPTWAKRVTIMFAGVSTNGTSDYLIQIGAGSVDTTGYLSTAVYSAGTSVNVGSSTAGFLVASSSAANLVSGVIQLVNMGSNVWVASGSCKTSTTTASSVLGDKTLAGALDRVRITTVGGANTFDAGSVNISWE